jgi:hypothetical protein
MGVAKFVFAVALAFFFLALHPWWWWSPLPWLFIHVLGTICLISGTILGIRRHHKGLFFFFVPFFASECFVFVIGKLAHRGDNFVPVAIAFLVLECVMVGGLIIRLSDARLDAFLIAMFCMCYAVFASFAAVVMFTCTVCP